MKFFHNGHIIELKGDDASTLHLLSSTQLRRLVRTESSSAYFHITMDPIKLPSSQHPSSSLLLEIQSLITKFTPMFQPHQAPPPSQPISHHIHLVPNSEPVNVCPYHYPHFQKAEIEAQVDSML